MRLGLAFLEQGKLFSQEQVLSDQGNTSRDQRPNERRQPVILQERVGFTPVRIELLRTTTRQTSEAEAPKNEWHGLVDGMGLEPTTPALRTRCSPN